MSEKRKWAGWKKIHLDDGVWHYRVHLTLIDLRDPDSRGYKISRGLFDAFTGGFDNSFRRWSEVYPRDVKQFILDCIRKPQETKFGVGDYVVPYDEELVAECCGIVTYIHKQFPRFVRVNWKRIRSGGWWADSTKIKSGYPSALHALADDIG